MGIAFGMAGRDAFLITGGLLLLLAVAVLIAGPALLAVLLALIAAALFWYSTRAKTPAP